MFAALVFAARAALAGQADVLDVKLTRNASGAYNFSVTIRHADTGWDHYADRWEVLAPDGTILATRVLTHPHVDEQPVTRTLDNVSLPQNVTRVRIRAHDTVHGFGGAEKEVDLATSTSNRLPQATQHPGP